MSGNRGSEITEAAHGSRQGPVPLRGKNRRGGQSKSPQPTPQQGVAPGPQESQDRYRTLFNTMTEGFALHEILCDGQGRPCDYRFLEVNPAFERQTNLRAADLIGRTVREVLPGIEPMWIERYGRVALTGQPDQFEAWSEPLRRWYDVRAFQTEPGRFGVVFFDITDTKRAQETLSKMRDELDQRVRERTGELVAANAALQAEVAERGRAEQAARAERQRLIDVLETLPAYLVLLTPDYHVPFANRFFRERFGESHGKRCFEYLFHRTEPCEVCETYKVLKTMAPLEWEWTGPDGRNYYIYDFPFTDTDGSTLIMEVGIDITEQKRAQEALRQAHADLERRVQERTRELKESEAALQEANEQLQAQAEELTSAIETLQDSEQALRDSQQDLKHAQAVAHTGSWRLEVERNELLWSEQTYRMFGIRLGTPLTYEAFLARVHPEDRRYVDEAWMAALHGEPYDIEHRILVAGEIKWVRERAELEFDSQGTLLGGFGTVQDITSRKQAEAQILQAKEQWERTFDSVPDLIAILDHEHRIVRANQAMAQRLGLTPQECVGQFCYRCVHGTTQPPAFCPHSLAVTDGRGHTAEVHEDHLGGDFLVSTTPLHDEWGRWIGSVHVARDITQRKQMEAQLRRLNDELEEEVQAQTEELRETIARLEQEASRRLAAEQQQEHAFHELTQRARQLQQLTLELAQAEDRERRRLAEILHDDLQQQLAAAKFHVSILGGRVKNDAVLQRMTGQLNQILNDAIDKSRSLSHELSPAVLHQGSLADTCEWLAGQMRAKHGLTVHVEARDRGESQSETIKSLLYRTAREILFNVAKHAHVDEARLRLQRQRGRVRMTIADRGQGFDPTTLGKTGGHGLLSIRERIELLGGRMKIRSAKDRGSIFAIAVPDAGGSEGA
jgi:PAS domain S-box-containing protein